MRNEPRPLYFQELEGFYAALEEMQDGISQMAQLAGVELQPGLERYVEQMFSLGIRLERLFCLSYGGSSRIVARSTSEINEEVDEHSDVRASCSCRGSNAWGATRMGNRLPSEPDTGKPNTSCINFEQLQ